MQQRTLKKKNFKHDTKERNDWSHLLVNTSFQRDKFEISGQITAQVTLLQN